MTAAFFLHDFTFLLGCQLLVDWQILTDICLN